MFTANGLLDPAIATTVLWTFFAISGPPIHLLVGGRRGQTDTNRTISGPPNHLLVEGRRGLKVADASKMGGTVAKLLTVGGFGPPPSLVKPSTWGALAGGPTGL